MREVLAAAGLALAIGCGSGSGGSGVATLSGGDAKPIATASVDPQDAFRQYAKCMRSNGVDMPDPGRPGDGGAVVIAPSAAPRRVAEAEEKCEHHLKGAIGDAPPPNDPAMQDRALKFARCMREHGIDMPDPGSDGAIRKRVGEGGDVEMPFSPDDPKFAEAQQACGGLLGGGVPGGQPGTVTVEGPK